MTATILFPLLYLNKGYQKKKLSNFLNTFHKNCDPRVYACFGASAYTRSPLH